MARTPNETFSTITLGHIRGHGCRHLLVYCGSIWCNHSIKLNADSLPTTCRYGSWEDNTQKRAADADHTRAQRFALPCRRGD
jgi:hypothetical protein